MKKLFTFIVGTVVGLGAYAQDFDSGDLMYSVLSPDDKTCAVTGYINMVSELEIPESVSFDGVEYSVTEIGQGAFRWSSVRNVSFPSTLEVIGESAFWNCNGLTEIVIPNSVKKLGDSCFGASYSLSRLELGSSLESIGIGAFSGCPINVVVALGEKPAQFIDGYLSSFDSDPLVAVSEELVAEYKAAWAGAKIVANISAESVSFDPDYYSVQPGGTVQLNWVVYPENAPVKLSTGFTNIITVDDNGLVTADSLKGDYNVTVTVTSLNGLTATCSIHTESLEEFESDGLVFAVIPNVENEVAIIRYDSTNTVLTIPENVEYNGNIYSVTTIGSGVFRWNDYIEEIFIPASVKVIGEESFSYCSSLKKVTIADSDTALKLSHYNFTDLNALAEIYIGRNLTCSDNAICFYWDYNLSKVELGAEVTSLPNYIFAQCYGLSIIRSLNPEPPVLGENPFGYNTLSIIVPAESVEAYQLAWEQYAMYITEAVYAESLSFDIDERTIYNGQYIQLPLNVEPVGATVLWSSSNQNLVSVDKDGIISYSRWTSGVGDAVITASTLNGLTAECKVTAKHWLTFSEENVSMTPGSNYQIDVTKPEELAESPVIWSSTDEEIVTVDENGLITAVGCGYAEINATVTVPGWEEDPFTYYIQVQVLNEPTAITSEESVINVWEGYETPINVSIEPIDDSYLNREITWTVADPEIAEVFTYYGTNYGVRGLKGGKTTITGETVNGLSVEIEVNVKVPVDRVIFATDRTYIAPGQTSKLEFTTVPEETNLKFTFTSDNEDIVSIDEDGIITAHNLGSTDIGVWAETPWGYSNVWWHRVEVCNFPESVTFAGTSDYEGSLTNWTYFQLEFTPDNEDVCKHIEWTAEDPSIVSIDSNDNSFIGREFGTTAFRGVAVNGDVLEGTISIKGIKILVNGEYTRWVDLNLGDQINLDIEASSSDLLENITYTSENPEIVTVTEDGLVTAVGCGKANIRVMSRVEDAENEWKYYYAYIELSVVPGEGIAFSVNKVNLIPGDYCYVSILRAENVGWSDVTWESSDENIVAITWSNEYEAELRYAGPGEATITATDANGNVATCLVTCFGIVVTPSNVDMYTNSTLQLDVKTFPEVAEMDPISWMSQDSEVVQVDENGVLTTTDVTGQTRIFAYTWINGYYVESVCDVSVSVFVPVTQITLNETAVSAEEGLEVQLIATINPEDASNKTLRWESNNEEVATVDQNGLVTIHSVGNAMIAVWATDGTDVFAYCNIYGTSGVEGIFGEEGSFDVYNMNGIIVKKDATAEDYKQLERGIYLIKKGDKVIKVQR